MKDIDFFRETIQEVATKKQTVADYKESIKEVKAVWQKAVEGGKSADVQLVADMVFWKDGFPEQDSVGKLRKNLDNFIKLVKLMEYAGKGDLVTSYLHGNGISLTVNSPMNPVYNNNSNDFLKTYNQAYDGSSPLTGSELYGKLVESTLTIMSEWYDHNEDVKDLKDMIKNKCETDSTTINTTTNLLTKKYEGKDISDDVHKVSQSIHDMEKALDQL